MDGTALGRRLAGRAPSLIAILGVAVVVVAIAHFLHDVRTLGFGLLPVASLALCLTLSIGLFGLSYWLVDSDFPVDDTWTVVRWCLGGMVGFGALAALTVGIRLAEGQTVEGAGLTLLVLCSGGGIGGGIAGIYYTRATLAARDADKRRDALVFLNSHLRHNVLNAAQVIQGYTSVLADRTDEPEYLTPIERRSDAIASLIDDMKELSDLFAGERTPTPLDISTVILREVESARETHESATFDVDVPPELYVMATGAVSAVFANLIENAVEHNDASSPSVTIRADRGPRTVSVRIADDGPGIRDDVKANLFDSAIESGEGRGIALVKTVMGHYGGDVSAYDNDPRGTEVVVEFRRPPGR
ncbi:ATP-binding protein [Haloplanus sp. C73]|uniref:ATP-binding protein n=1 Tax=Haloplanus sp. C73 TaxID=3421641 RepID=UPI003EBD4BDF